MMQQGEDTVVSDTAGITISVGMGPEGAPVICLQIHLPDLSSTIPYAFQVGNALTLAKSIMDAAVYIEEKGCEL